MARAPAFYVVKFKNRKVDPFDHFMIFMVPYPQTLAGAIAGYKIAYPQLEIDRAQQARAFASKPEAQEEADRLSAIAQALTPDRVPATDQYAPGEANRILEEGKPGETPLPGTISE